MTEIGYVRPNSDDLHGECSGRIITHYLDTAFQLQPATVQAHPNAPTHYIVGRSIAGSLTKIGAAWLKTVQRGDNVGQEFFSLTFDVPGLPSDINVAAFKNADNASFTIQWRRRRG